MGWRSADVSPSSGARMRSELPRPCQPLLTTHFQEIERLAPNSLVLRGTLRNYNALIIRVNATAEITLPVCDHSVVRSARADSAPSEPGDGTRVALIRADEVVGVPVT